MNLEDIPFDDPATFDLLSRGETEGIFQVNSYLGQKTCKAVRPREFSELVAIMALTRPASIDNKADEEYVKRKASGDRRVNVHPELDDLLTEILYPTYSGLLYQEQVMEIIAQVTGWGYGEADDIFNSMRKKNLEKMESSKPSFYEAAGRRGFSSESMDALWEVLVPFSDYSFGKAHSVGYAYITYRSAYLKTHYPVEFLSSMLTRASDIAEIGKFTAESHRMNIPVLPPDINASEVDFRPERGSIRYGLQSIKGIGEDVAESIVLQRPFGSIDQFFRRADRKVLNAKVLDALIRSGCLNSLWPRRDQLLAQAAELGRLALLHRREARRGQNTAVRVRYRPSGQEVAVGEVAEEDYRSESARHAAWERELLGTQFTTGRVWLHLSRPLTGVEWEWVKTVLTNRGQRLQPVSATLNRTEFTLPVKTSYSDHLAGLLAGVGIEMEER